MCIRDRAWAIRDSLDALLRVFPVRTCTKGVYQRAERSGRPCLLGYIDKCSAPCVGEISQEDHRALADDLCRFMAGHAKPYIRELTRQMNEAAEAMDFETAAARRDDIGAVSYTHLDVYKRQVPRSPVSPVIWHTCSVGTRTSREHGQ